MEHTLDQLDTSLNFIVGFTNYSLDFDPLDNRYFELVGYEMTAAPSYDVPYSLEERYDLTACDDLNFIPRRSRSFYPKGVCFKDRDQVRVHRNWYSFDWKVPSIALTYCTTRPDCASVEETDAFLAENPMYFVY